MTWLVVWVVRSFPLALVLAAMMKHDRRPLTPAAVPRGSAPSINFGSADLDAELRDLLRAAR